MGHLDDESPHYSHQPIIRPGYEDLLNDLRMVGDLRWSLSSHGPSQLISQSSSSIKEQVFRSARVRDVISHLTSKSGGSSPHPPPTEEALGCRVNQIIEEMGHQYNIKYIRLLGYVLIKAVRRMYDHVWVSTEELQDIQLLFAVPDVPVLFMPTHRSYADFLIVSFVAFHYGLPLPVIASGIDFLGMTGVGQILRRSGAFFIRRSFADDALYRAVFSEYVQAILCATQPLEFFVEGTRSRSGKSLYPKFGLLQTAVEVFLRGRVSDIMVVPVSLTYERTLEENLYAAELLGIPKPRESTLGLLKARKVLADNYGSMWFHVGKTISVREFLTGKIDRRLYGTVPKNLIVMDGNDASAVKELAFAAIHEQQTNMRIHDWTVLATVILHRFRRKECTFLLSNILHECNLLLNLLHHTAPDHEPHRCFSYRSVDHCLRIHGSILKRDNSNPGFVELQPDRLKHPEVLHMLLAHYRNQLLHRVVPSAVDILVQGAHWKSGDAESFLTKLFSREFVILSGGFGRVCLDTEGSFKRDETRLLLEIIVEPFLVAYDMILQLLQSNLFATRSVFRTVKELTLIIQPAMRKLLDDGIYGGYEILSCELIANCIYALKEIGGLLLRDKQLVLNRKVIAHLNFQLSTFMSIDIVLSISDAVEQTFGNIRAGVRI